MGEHAARLILIMDHELNRMLQMLQWLQPGEYLHHNGVVNDRRNGNRRKPADNKQTKNDECIARREMQRD